MANIWPFYGQNMVFTWSFKLVLPEYAADLWGCEAGCGRVESLRHIQVCPGYAELWNNRSKDDTLDTIHYLQDVVMIRMGLTKYK